MEVGSFPFEELIAVRQNDSNDQQHVMARQIEEVIIAFQKKSTGHMPTAVTVVLSEDTLVITLHEALTRAEKVLAATPDGASQVQDFHRQLFMSSSVSLRHEIERITGRKVAEAAAEVEPTSGTIVHAFTTGTMVQVFLLKPNGNTKEGATE